MSYGEKISALRKRKGMTQAELGDQLNVTYQAVSKWERDESDPDFATMAKIAKLFDVPLAFFSEDDYEEEAAATLSAQQEANVPQLIGVCKVCGKTVYEGNVGEENPALICKACKTRQATERANAERERIRQQEAKKRYELEHVLHQRNKGLIASACITGALLIAVIVGMAMSQMEAGLIAGGAAVTLVFIFPFIAQLFWDGFIVDVVLAGVKVVGTPGIIFTFDLDGFIFLIAMKILFAIIKFFLFILIFMFMLMVAIVISPVAFVPAMIKLSTGHELG